MTLAVRAWLAAVTMIAVVGLVLFVGAGTIRYWQGWVYVALLAGASVVITVYLLRADPALLERRMRGGPTAERRPVQKLIIIGVQAAFVASFIVPALDRRFRWSDVPVGGVLLGDLFVVFAFCVILLVYRENTFTSAVVEVAKDQIVISTGPYAIVRHPMYAALLLNTVGTTLALASYWGLISVVLLIPFLAWRLLDEEQFLAANLPGYAEYQQRVRYRLLPYLW
jgi:protein-S-isoprenylcysteine O-methyltransferase Ste14